MNVIHADPPNRAEIEESLGPLPEGVIFAYAPNVYVPSGRPLTSPLRAHESVHLRQQGDDPETWWERYLLEPDFRLSQEIEAHRAEWREVQRALPDRNQQNSERIAIARRLSGPLYGNAMTMREALRQIKDV